MNINDRAFVTGSYAYGIPMGHSDIDLVVFVTDVDLQKLAEMADLEYQLDNCYEALDARSLRFGKLNLICTTTEEQYNLWKRATAELRKQKPVSRKDACEHFAHLRSVLGFN